MTGNKNLIIILAASLILLTAGVYYMSQVNQLAESDEDRELQVLGRQSSSDDTDSIETDLKSTNFDNSDKELLNIEAELKSSTEAKTK